MSLAPSTPFTAAQGSRLIRLSAASITLLALAAEYAARRAPDLRQAEREELRSLASMMRDTDGLPADTEFDFTK